MQKIGLIVILICLLVGCATMDGGLSNYEPVAIVSVVSNKMINWEGEEDYVEGIADQFVRDSLFPNQTDSKVTKSSAEELVEEAAMIMFDAIEISKIASIVPPTDVLETPAYFRTETNTRLDPEDYVKPVAYKFINNADKNLAINLAHEEGIRSTMYLDFTFIKSLANGFMKTGDMMAKVIMRITLLDENGKTLYFRSHEYWSQNRIEVVSAAYDNEALMELFREALYEAATGLVNIMNQK